MSAETKGEAATSALTFYDFLIEVKSPIFNSCAGTDLVILRYISQRRMEA
jgi:hypothetical protein